MNIKEDLQRAIVTAWAASPAITPETIHFDRAPKDASLPYGIFFIDITGEEVNDGMYYLTRVQFNLFSDEVSSESINDFAEKVRNKFNRKLLTLLGGNAMISEMILDTEGLFQNEDDHWQVTQFFDCRTR